LCIEKEGNNYWIGTEGGLVLWGEISGLKDLYTSPTYLFDGNVVYLKDPSRISIYSIEGKIIAEKENAVSLSISDYSLGFYVLSINNESFLFYKY